MIYIYALGILRLRVHQVVIYNFLYGFATIALCQVFQRYGLALRGSRNCWGLGCTTHQKKTAWKT